MEINSIHPESTQEQTAKELGFNGFTIKRYRKVIKTISLYKSSENQNEIKRPQKNLRNTQKIFRLLP